MINQEAQSRRAQILDAALHVIAEHGFRGASIKRIAARAGLRSPALIYWYFRDKDQLLEALLHEIAPLLDQVAAAEPLVDEPPERVLPVIANAFLGMVHQPVTARLMRVVLSESARHPAVASFFAQRGPLVVLTFLERHLRRQIELGRLRPHDTRASARAFMGMLVVYALGHEIFPPLGAGFPQRETYAEFVVNLFLEGLRK
jgi:TetR/AcrR family transcriptional regulator